MPSSWVYSFLGHPLLRHSHCSWSSSGIPTKSVPNLGAVAAGSETTTVPKPGVIEGPPTPENNWESMGSVKVTELLAPHCVAG